REIAARLRVERSAAGDELQPAVTVRSVDGVRRESRLQIYRYHADHEMCDDAICQRDVDVISRPQGPQLEEHRWSLVGVDVAENDRRTHLAGRWPEPVPAWFLEVGGDLHGAVTIEAKLR